MRRSGCQRRRIVLGAEQERGTGEDACQAGANAGIEVAACRPLLFVHGQRGVEIDCGHRPAERAARDGRQDRVRARRFLRSRLRRAHEQFLSRVCAAETARIVGPFDDPVTQPRQA